MVSSKDMYKYRLMIRDLYIKNNSDDLFSIVSDKLNSDSINKIELNNDILNKEFGISVTFDKNTDSTDISSTVESTIKDFVTSNIDKIKVSDKEKSNLKTFIDENPNLLYDKFIIGSNIHFSL